VCNISVPLGIILEYSSYSFMCVVTISTIRVFITEKEFNNSFSVVIYKDTSLLRLTFIVFITTSET